MRTSGTLSAWAPPLRQPLKDLEERRIVAVRQELRIAAQRRQVVIVPRRSNSEPLEHAVTVVGQRAVRRDDHRGTGAMLQALSLVGTELIEHRLAAAATKSLLGQ